MKDEAIGSNFVRARSAAGLSQQEIANAMRERGWKWGQSTVFAVEHGTRPLRLNEAADVAEILKLDSPLPLLSTTSDAVRISVLLYRLDQSRQDFRESARRVMRESLAVAQDAEEAGIDGDERILDELRWTIGDEAFEIISEEISRLADSNPTPLQAEIIKMWHDWGMLRL